MTILGTAEVNLGGTRFARVFGPDTPTGKAMADAVATIQPKGTKDALARIAGLGRSPAVSQAVVQIAATATPKIDYAKIAGLAGMDMTQFNLPSVRPVRPGPDLKELEALLTQPIDPTPGLLSEVVGAQARSAEAMVELLAEQRAANERQRLANEEQRLVNEEQRAANERDRQANERVARSNRRMLRTAIASFVVGAAGLGITVAALLLSH